MVPGGFGKTGDSGLNVLSQAENLSKQIKNHP
jgi:hypothetical protein